MKKIWGYPHIYYGTLIFVMVVPHNFDLPSTLWGQPRISALLPTDNNHLNIKLFAFFILKPLDKKKFACKNADDVFTDNHSLSTKLLDWKLERNMGKHFFVLYDSSPYSVFN